ncbi:MAG: sel1 repeat family protein [Bacteroidales bacterium]|jgi:TPR repeat protein|nr:sel1 repeat family protein [Bacteroidales bacterium]
MKSRIFALVAVLCLSLAANAQNYERKAKSGNVQAQFALANQYYSGIGRLQDYKQAFVWFEKAAKGGNVDAMYSVATMYEDAKGTKENIREAFNYYLKAAERGNHSSQLKVANMFESGRGCVKSDARAYLWYRVCAERGDLLSCRKLGDYYAQGNVVGKDHAEAKFWYEKTIDEFKVLIQSKLPLDEANADKIASEAINEVIIAMNNLAEIYTADQGIAPDADKAKELKDEAKKLQDAKGNVLKFIQETRKSK